MFRPSRSSRRLFALCLLVPLTLFLHHPAATAQVPRPPASGEQGLSPREAAAQAKAQYGGKVLKVQRKGKAYRVRLLLEDGRVITVTIKG